VLNQSNYNSINISGKWALKKIHEIDEYGCYSGVVESTQNTKTKNVDIFIKNAPLLDPVKYMVGVYHTEIDKITNLPQFTEGASNEEGRVISKLNNAMNSSYVDNLFNIINSQLLEKGFIHGIEWYGSFLAIKNDFEFNIYDDLDYLFHSNYFLKNVGSLFHVPKEILQEIKKPTLKIEDSEDIEGAAVFNDFEEITEEGEPLLASVSTPSLVDISTSTSPIAEPIIADIPLDLVEEQVVLEKEDETLSNSSYSSRTSYTNEYTDIPPHDDSASTGSDVEDEDCPELAESYTGGKTKEHEEGGHAVSGDGDDADDVDNEEDEMSEGSMGSDYDEEYIGATIPEFPVQMICIEACVDTLDSLMLNDELQEHELFSCMMQIIMILATYQKLFQFTHNDLHTNNVMFIETNKKYIRYEYNNKKYLVPTYGKIYKIIDFGRSIFTIQNQVFCGDCYQKNGDAYAQYNFGPCLNEEKAEVAPNYSFDLCRLACSMFDHCISNISEVKNEEVMTPFKKLVARLCTDDKGLNVLYKRNNEERYPCFKLYKMIARTVHNHTPDMLLETEDFAKYAYDGTLPAGVSKKECYEVNIDNY
jgi:hypothetical protein